MNHITGSQDRQCTHNVTLRYVRATIAAVERQGVLHKMCAFVALGIQRAMRMRHIVICPARLYNIFFHVNS